MKGALAMSTSLKRGRLNTVALISLTAAVVALALPTTLSAAEKCPAVVAFEDAEKELQKAENDLKSKVRAELEEKLRKIKDAYKDAKDALESAQRKTRDVNQRLNKLKQSADYKEHGSKLKFDYETADALVKRLDGLIQNASFWQSLEAGKIALKTMTGDLGGQMEAGDQFLRTQAMKDLISNDISTYTRARDDLRKKIFSSGDKLKKEIADLEDKIRRAESITGKPGFNQKRVQIRVLARDVQRRMPGFSPDDYWDILKRGTYDNQANDSSYKTPNFSALRVNDEELGAAADKLLNSATFSSPGINRLKKELGSARAATKAVFRVGGKNPWDKVEELAPQLLAEIEKVQGSVKSDLNKLGKDQDALIPAPGTRELVINLNSNRKKLAEKKALLEKEKTAIPKLASNLAQIGADQFEAGWKEHFAQQVFDEVKRRRDVQVPRIETRIKNIDNYYDDAEFDDEDFKRLKEAKKDAEKKFKDKKKAKEEFEQKVETALTRAQTSARPAWNRFKPEITEFTEIRRKAEQIRKLIPKIRAKRNELNKKIKALEGKPQSEIDKKKAVYLKEWKPYKDAIDRIKVAKPAIRKRHQEIKRKAEHMLRIVQKSLNGLDAFKCDTEVHSYRTRLFKARNILMKILGLDSPDKKLSPVTGMYLANFPKGTSGGGSTSSQSSGCPMCREKIKINCESISPGHPACRTAGDSCTPCPAGADLSLASVKRECFTSMNARLNNPQKAEKICRCEPGSGAQCKGPWSEAGR